MIISHIGSLWSAGGHFVPERPFWGPQRHLEGPEGPDLVPNVYIFIGKFPFRFTYIAWQT